MQSFTLCGDLTLSLSSEPTLNALSVQTHAANTKRTELQSQDSEEGKAENLV